jgi:hypothetical protein
MPDTETDEQMLARISPLRIVMGKVKDGNALSCGVVERSFSMDLDFDRVGVWWSGTASTIIGNVTIDAVEDADHHHAYFTRHHPDFEFVILDPLAEDCPIEVDITQWLADLRIGQRKKYEARNATWKIKDPELVPG